MAKKPTRKKSLNGTKSRVMLNYRHTTQDPVISLLGRLRDQSGETDREINKRVGNAPSTMKNWWSGKTRFPQHKTMAEYAGAFGKRFVLEDANNTDPIIRKRR